MVPRNIQYEKKVTTKVGREIEKRQIFLFLYRFINFTNTFIFFYRGRRHTLLLLGVIIDNVDASHKHFIILIKINKKQ